MRFLNPMKDEQYRELLPGISIYLKRFHGILIGISASLAVTAGLSQTALADPQTRMDVLELFTSQGCASCPPADALLKEFSKREGLLALSFPVSYWDDLGWKDTLAKDEYNERQYSYAASRGTRQVYTPHLVVNGLMDVIGSHEDEAEAAIRKTSRMLETANVPLSIDYKRGMLHLSVGTAPDGSAYRSGKLWVACYSRSVDVSIKRGENTGRKISYTNVVRELLPAGRWDGHKTSLTIEIPSENEFDNVAVLLQADKTHAVLAAAALPLHSQ